MDCKKWQKFFKKLQQVLPNLSLFLLLLFLFPCFSDCSNLRLKFRFRSNHRIISGNELNIFFQERDENFGKMDESGKCKNSRLWLEMYCYENVLLWKCIVMKISFMDSKKENQSFKIHMFAIDSRFGNWFHSHDSNQWQEMLINEMLINEMGN